MRRKFTKSNPDIRDSLITLIHLPFNNSFEDITGNFEVSNVNNTSYFFTIHNKTGIVVNTDSIVFTGEKDAHDIVNALFENEFAIECDINIMSVNFTDNFIFSLFPSNDSLGTSLFCLYCKTSGADRVDFYMTSRNSESGLVAYHYVDSTSRFDWIHLSIEYYNNALFFYIDDVLLASVSDFILTKDDLNSLDSSILLGNTSINNYSGVLISDFIIDVRL